MIAIVRRYDLEVAHRLTAGVPEKHKCRRLHGHRYRLKLTVSGKLDRDGMLIEYESLDRVVWPVLRLVDHHDLNTLDQRCSTPEAIVVAANPTAEQLVLWLAVRLTGIVASARNGGAALSLKHIQLEEDAQSAVEMWLP